MHVGLMGQVWRVWAPQGVKVEQVLEYQREWAYLNLVVNGSTGQSRWDWTANMKGISITSILQSWAEQGVEVVV